VTDARAAASRRFWRDPSARWPAIVILLVCLAAVIGPPLWRYSATAQQNLVTMQNRPPSLDHPFGTDQASRDLLARVLVGARVSLSVAALSVLISATIGTWYGLVAGYVGGALDAVMMRVNDALLSIPRVLLLIAVLALWYPVPLSGLIALLGLTGWFGVSRLVRAEVRTARGRDYVLAARALGAGHWRIMLRHLLPNVLAPVIVAATLGVGNVIVLEAGLSYLGIGVQQPLPSWGSIFLDGSGSFTSAWWIALFPGIAIVVTVLAFNVLGDALRDLLDPRQVDRVAAPGAGPGNGPRREHGPRARA
jgi:peptide/nickel transport system permease protein